MINNFGSTRSLRPTLQGLLLTSTLFTIVGTGAAYAQTAAHPAATSAGEISEIVVTANRRSENIQDVGASITSESANTLQAMNIVRAEDLAKLVPGFTAIPNNGSAVSTFTIRGISQADEAEEQEEPVATYLDGVYIALPAATGFPFYDIDHVEILRGPQGTLFGKNATGGLVSVISRQPKPGFAAGVTVSAGDYNYRHLEGYINGGTDTLSDRLALYVNSRDGYVKNLSGKNLNSTKGFGFRNQLAYRFDDNTNVTLKIEHWQESGTSQNWEVPTEPGIIPGALGDHVLPLFTPDLYGYVKPSADPLVEAVNDPGQIAKRANTVALSFEHEMGAVKLAVTGSYQRDFEHYDEDTDGTPNNGQHYSDKGHVETLELEARAIKSTGAFRWTAGVNLFSNKGPFEGSFDMPTLCSGASPTSCNIVVPADNATGLGAKISGRYAINNRSYSVFGQMDYDVTDKLSVTLGARYSYEQQRFNYNFLCSETVPDGCLSIFGVPPGTGGNPAGDFSQTYPQPLNLAQRASLYSGKAEVNYKLADHVLAYALVARGVKSGGYFNAAVANVLPSKMSFKPETLYSGEVGLKSDLLNGRLRLNADYYHYIYRNSQQFNITNGIFYTIVNLPAVADGAELEATYWFGHGLTLDLNGAYNRLRVKDVQPCGTCALQTEDGINAPHFTGAARVEEKFNLAGVAFTYSLNAHYTGSRYFLLVNSPIVRGSPYTVVDTALRGDLSDGTWFELWANNLTNKIYATAIFDNTPFGQLNHWAPPRMVGITVGKEF